MFLKLLLIVAAMFCTMTSAVAFSVGDTVWGAVLAACVVANLFNLATAKL